MLSRASLGWLFGTFATLTIYPPMASAAWVELIVADNGNRISVETGTIRRQAHFVWFWTQVKYPSDRGDGATETKVFQSANCRTKQYRMRTVISFDAQGEMVGSEENGDRAPLEPTPPDSVQSAVINYVCGN